MLHSLFCDSDAIVVASPVSSDTDLTESGNFLFTDYIMNVVKSVKLLSGAQIGERIIVTRPGGETSINGRHVITEALDFPLFKDGTTYRPVLTLPTRHGNI